MSINRTTRRYLLVILGLILIYIMLLTALVYAEKDQPGAEIRTFADAVWYSLTTLSTVGYGDMTPKSHLGHVIGVVFLLMSMGVLVAIFGSVITALTSEGLPLFRLRLRRDMNWYYLADFTPEADTLARDIIREDDNAVVIYGVSRNKELENPEYPCFFINVSPARIVAHKKGIGSRCKVFFLEENDIGRNIRAVDAHKLDADVYASTMSGQESMSGNIFFFHTYDCCARSYWRENPLTPSENDVVLIGCGNYSKAILKRAILTNINDSDFDVSYHVFGDWQRFREIHNSLDGAFGINERHQRRDSIYFHDCEWTAAHDVIRDADRIIICRDDEPAGWDDLWQLQRYYEYKGKIFLKSNRSAPGVEYFGTDAQIFTVNQIVRTRLNDAARLLNDMYRSSVDESLGWDELGDSLRQSKIAAADHLYMKIGMLLDDRTVTALDRKTITDACESLRRIRREPSGLDKLRQIEHSRWVRFYSYYNWRYGKTRDEEHRLDPKICDYELLSEEQKAYYDRAWNLIEETAIRLGPR